MISNDSERSKNLANAIRQKMADDEAAALQKEREQYRAEFLAEKAEIEQRAIDYTRGLELRRGLKELEKTELVTSLRSYLARENKSLLIGHESDRPGDDWASRFWTKARINWLGPTNFRFCGHTYIRLTLDKSGFQVLRCPRLVINSTTMKQTLGLPSYPSEELIRVGGLGGQYDTSKTWRKLSHMICLASAGIDAGYVRTILEMFAEKQSRTAK